VAFAFSVRDGHGQPAATLTAGQVFRLSLGSWKAQKAYARLPLDDSLGNLDSPEFFILDSRPNR
jgi:hypothetical protein